MRYLVETKQQSYTTKEYLVDAESMKEAKALVENKAVMPVAVNHTEQDAPVFNIEEIEDKRVSPLIDEPVKIVKHIYMRGLPCEVCGALMVEPNNHKEWHEGINQRINEAAQVGAHADMMTKPIGGQGPKR